ncbi:MAG: hypothetical protein N3F09_09535 [Bacteroidia bacterium]|nr:hypothetical protein [Bacteroidia bacterium]
MRRKKNIIIIIGWMLLLPFFHHLWAQTEKLFRAHKLYLEKKFEWAKSAIDSAALHNETSNLSETHTVRAFIYYELYKKTEKNLIESKLRDTIVKSIMRSESLNPDSVNHNNNIKLLNNIAINYFNMANNVFQEQKNDELSEKLYIKFKELMKSVNPQFNSKEKDIEFYNALGSHYASEFNSQIAESNTINKKAGEKGKIYLTKVLEIDPDNDQANLNLGLMYYSEAVQMIKSLDAATDLLQLDIVQENTSKLARKAENFVLKVYNKNNSNKLAVEALYYIYRALCEKEKYMEFDKKCAQLGIQVNK